jgi:hypothetical protein
MTNYKKSQTKNTKYHCKKDLSRLWDIRLLFIVCQIKTNIQKSLAQQCPVWYNIEA